MRPPVSTYRLQITADFDLYAAARTLPYLHDLGVDWVYLSPLLAAEPGSSHGYDVVAFDRIDPDRGGPEGLAAVSAEARRLGMGVLVDIVPNHVGVATPPHNSWWWELLRDGPDGPRAASFDVDWEAGDGRIRIPVLGDDDQPAPDAPIKNLQVVDGELHYHDHRFPLTTGSGQSGVDPNAVHDRQHYRLVNWRTADDQLNYRRFFAINTLAAVRVEDPVVFAESHAEVRRWFDEGLVDGLRVDHPDGLRDPRGYLAALADLTGGAYTVVEKILEPGEELERDWATAGTTGYDALAWIDRVLVDPTGREVLESLENRLRGGRVNWPELTHGSKRVVADTSLRSEVKRITREIVATTDPPIPESDVAGVEDAVAELLACFPVYRSYLPAGRGHFELALAEARARRSDLGRALDLLELVLGDEATDPAQRFQQTSGMVMAKGVEDCAFYRWSRLTSLNEVGGDPSVFSAPVPDFHAWADQRQAEWPTAMTCLSTHDTKRGEDVRARLDVLAEIPTEWADSLQRLLAAVPLRDTGFASLLWQAVVGCWPASRERLHGYAEKAMREAGDRTSWTAPDADYEAAVHAGVDAAFDDPEVAGLVTALAERLADPGWSNSLSAKLVALTMPGVPDVYQGSELWEQSLVDPDNRRPVDFEARAALLSSSSPCSSPCSAPSGIADTGAAKLAVVSAALRTRRDRPELFTTYRPLSATGPTSEHLLAFDRGGAITLATRLPIGLARRGGWGTTTLSLPEGSWRRVTSGSAQPVAGEVPVSELLGGLPVALLVREA